MFQLHDYFSDRVLARGESLAALKRVTLRNSEEGYIYSGEVTAMTCRCVRKKYSNSLNAIYDVYKLRVPTKHWNKFEFAPGSPHNHGGSNTIELSSTPFILIE